MPIYQDINSGTATNSSSVITSVNQVAHGFTVGKWVYWTGSNWALTNDVFFSTMQAIGVVSNVVDADNFKVTTSGLVTGLPLLPSPVGNYYISGASGDINNVKQVGKVVLTALSDTSGIVQSYSHEKVQPFVPKITAFTATWGESYNVISSANFTITIPSPNQQNGREITLYRSDNTTNIVTITPASGTINGSPNMKLPANFVSITLRNNGTNIIATETGSSTLTPLYRTNIDVRATSGGGTVNLLATSAQGGSIADNFLFTTLPIAQTIVYSGTNGASGLGISSFATVTKTGDTELALNTATGKVTIPTTGRYTVSGTISVEAPTNAHYVVQIIKNGTTLLSASENNGTGNIGAVPISFTGDLVSGDTLELRYGTGVSTSYMYGLNWSIIQLPSSVSVPVDVVSTSFSSNRPAFTTDSVTNIASGNWQTPLQPTTARINLLGTSVVNSNGITATNPVTAQTSLTITQTGKYLLNAGISYANNSVPNIVGYQWVRNGTTVIAGSAVSNDPAPQTTFGMNSTPAAVGHSAGSGTYKFSLPSGYTIDTTKVTTLSSVDPTLVSPNIADILGTVEMNRGSQTSLTTKSLGHVYAADANTVAAASMINTYGTYVMLDSAAGSAALQSGIGWKMQFTVPII